MPIEVGIWKIDGELKRVYPSPLDAEDRLEAMIERDPALIDPDLMIIGRQVITDYGPRIDLLGVHSDGSLAVIELKRDRTPREVVAQLLDYGSWVTKLAYDDLVRIYEEHAGSSSVGAITGRFEEAFAVRFGMACPETLNDSHRLVIVASSLDPSTERIIGYLSGQFGVPINAVFFQHFLDEGNEYLARTWLQEPREVETSSVRTRPIERRQEIWNGTDFYVSLGEGETRSWDDCVRYGFISAGQGRWYSQTLNMLFPGARVFVYIPGRGYVGVGTVTEGPRKVTDVTVELNGSPTPLLEAPLAAPHMDRNADDPDKSEYVVRVEWIKTLGRDEGIWEPGMFANRNSACRLRSKFTLERLHERFGLE